MVPCVACRVPVVAGRDELAAVRVPVVNLQVAGSFVEGTVVVEADILDNSEDALATVSASKLDLMAAHAHTEAVAFGTFGFEVQSLLLLRRYGVEVVAVADVFNDPPLVAVVLFEQPLAVIFDSAAFGWVLLPSLATAGSSAGRRCAAESCCCSSDVPCPEPFETCVAGWGQPGATALEALPRKPGHLGGDVSEW